MSLPVPPLPPALVTAAALRFRRGDERTRRLLARRAHCFVRGYRTMRRSGGGPGIHTLLAVLPDDDRGFAYEGAALAAAAAGVLPGRAADRHLHALLDGPGHGFAHLIHVGAGWLAAVLPDARVLDRPALDPLLRWLALDGAGFAHGFFRGPRWIARQAVLRRRARPVDLIRLQGIGRSLWFAECGDLAAIRAVIRRFPATVRPELWAGVGLAVCYAGGADRNQAAGLADLPADQRRGLAQGAAFAAGARHRSGHVPGHTRESVLLLTGVSPEVAAGWTVDAERVARSLGPGPGAYLAWQADIRRRAPSH